MMLKSAKTDGAGALDIILGLDRQNLAARQAHEDRHGGQADGDHRIGEARAQEGGERDRDDQEGHREEALR